MGDFSASIAFRMIGEGAALCMETRKDRVHSGCTSTSEGGLWGLLCAGEDGSKGGRWRRIDLFVHYECATRADANDHLRGAKSTNTVFEFIASGDTHHDLPLGLLVLTAW